MGFCLCFVRCNHKTTCFLGYMTMSSFMCLTTNKKTFLQHTGDYVVRWLKCILFSYYRHFTAKSCQVVKLLWDSDGSEETCTCKQRSADVFVICTWINSLFYEFILQCTLNPLVINHKLWYLHWLACQFLLFETWFISKYFFIHYAGSLEQMWCHLHCDFYTCHIFQ